MMNVLNIVTELKSNTHGCHGCEVDSVTDKTCKEE